MKTKTLFAIAAAAGVISLTTSAYAGAISGEIYLSGTFSKLPDVGNASVVSALSFIDISHTASVDLGTGTGWFASMLGASANNINLDPLQPVHFTYVLNGPDQTFTFLATAISHLVRGTPSCTDTACTDSLTFDISGVVSGGGFSTTAFTGTWSGVGSCTALDHKCVSGVDGTWRVYLDPPVPVNGVPEPGSTALLGIGLGVLGFIIRRRKA